MKPRRVLVKDKVFWDFIDASFLQQHVMKPTRVKDILELATASDDMMIEHIVVGEHFSTSDHQIVR